MEEISKRKYGVISICPKRFKIGLIIKILNNLKHISLLRKVIMYLLRIHILKQFRRMIIEHVMKTKNK